MLEHRTVLALLVGLSAPLLFGGDALLEDASIYVGLPTGFGLDDAETRRDQKIDTELRLFLDEFRKNDAAALEGYASRFPSSPLADDALLAAGKFQAAAKEPARATELFRKCWQEHPNAVALDTVFLQFEGRGKIYPEETKRYIAYRRHIKRFPNHTADLALIELGKVYRGCGRIDAATECLNEVIKRHPQGEHAAEDKAADISVFYDPERPFAHAMELLAEINSKRNNTMEAQRLLRRIIELYPQSNLALKATICLAEADMAAGNRDVARTLVAREITTLEGMAETADRNDLRNRASESRATVADLRKRFLSGDK